MVTADIIKTEKIGFFSKLIGPIFVAIISVIVGLLLSVANDMFGAILMASINFISVYAFHKEKSQFGILWAPYYYLFFVISIYLLFSDFL